jgi:hemolysin III
VLYTVGAVAYATKRPNPWPGWFGYHEVFHAFVVVAAFLHYLAVLALVDRP